jgi:hypothetical protein
MWNWFVVDEIDPVEDAQLVPQNLLQLASPQLVLFVIKRRQENSLTI